MNYSQARWKRGILPQDRYKLEKKRTEELLFTCVRRDAGARSNYIRALIDRGVDFAYLGVLVRAHCVSSLVYNALKFYTPENVCDQKALKSLHVAYLEADAKNSFYKNELLNILGAFAEKNIPVIPLKGIILSEYLYGDTTSRGQSVDMDLLVKDLDVGRARAALEELGYTFRRVDEAEEYQWYHIFTRPGMPMIELHWDITMMVRNRARIDGLWQTAQPTNSSGVEYYYLKPEEHLMYLASHLASSGAFRQLRHLCDIERLIVKYGGRIDWDGLVRKARQWRMAGSLYAALGLIREFSGPIFPQKTLCELKVAMPKRFLIRLFANKRVIVGGGFRRRVLDTFLSYTFFEIIEALSFKDYSNILRRIFFPPKETIGGSGYCLRIFNGAVKLARQITT